ncbi:MAG TPA: regulatory protein RecX [Syntrophales bacterium]|nr:regulatory protein RecX [Syntrophales bacterium]HOL59052.1 regulatory protein RecX [Syntrophales bacterium]HPO35439.1 regulatory protein RecX [Syntrophales bacterium]
MPGNRTGPKRKIRTQSPNGGITPPSEIKTYAFKWLGYRDLTEAELRKKLEQKGFEAKLIDEVLTDLKQMGYIDDRSLCERLVRYLASERLWGDKRIEATLVGKGLPPDLVIETLATIRKELSEEEALRQYLDKVGTKRVSAGKLIYRGFPPALVYEVLHGRNDDEGR